MEAFEAIWWEVPGARSKGDGKDLGCRVHATLQDLIPCEGGNDGVLSFLSSLPSRTR